MKVRIVQIGNVYDIELSDRATVAELLCASMVSDWDDIEVRVGDAIKYPDDRLSEGDIVFILRPISGAAPLPPGKMEEGVRELRNFTSGARKLILIDPYLLKPRKLNTDYVKLMSHCTNLESKKLKQLHFVHSWKYNDRDIVSRICTEFARCGCEVTRAHTDEIHDRVWIRDNNKAIAVGTSLNSIGGGKLAFVLNLPATDVDYLLQFLTDHHLI